MTRIALGIQYDGAAFSGWQTQPHGHTVQDILEKAIVAFSGCKVDKSTLHLHHSASAPISAASSYQRAPGGVVAAGRTDAGVHALGQVVHFDTDLTRRPFSWVRGVNAFLPSSISVQWAQPVSETFHARFSAVKRTYYYALYVQPMRSPFLVGRAGWVPQPLELEPMREAAAYLIGEHDFSAFRAAQCQAHSPCKHLYALDITQRGAFIFFRFEATAFLYHMVRNLLGSLLMVGRQQKPAHWVQDILETRDRQRAAPTFMPDGLYLAHIHYPEIFDLPKPVMTGWLGEAVWPL